ncbi:MAG: hypothetical protein ACE5LU_15415 [Anaerolineae bacterium]
MLVRQPILALIDRAEALRAEPRGEAARAWVQSFGPLAPLAYIALFVAQILLAPLPGAFMGLMGGYADCGMRNVGAECGQSIPKSEIRNRLGW